jgi:hypothetical protein
MTNENLRMQMLSGVITESEYKAKLEENAEKTSLNESMIGGIVGIGAINQIPPRAKADYEMAFEHFLGERYQIKPNRERDDIKDVNEEDTVEDMEERTESEAEMAENKKPGTAKERSAMAKKARAGKDIGEKGKNFEKIAKSAAKQYGSKEAGEKVAGAVMYGKLKEETLEEGDDDLFTAKRFYKRTDNPRINILANLDAINDIVMDMLETDLVKGYGPDERDFIYQEYMNFVNAVKNLVK